MDLANLVLSTRGREPLFLDVGPRRAALRVLARVAGPRTWLFALADDHAHLVVDDPNPTRLGGHLALAFAALPGAPSMQASFAQPVDGRDHLRRLVTYVLRQPEHHGLGDPAAWEGTCLHDLVGARRLPGFDATAWQRGLPREDLTLVWDAVRLDRPAGVALAGYPLPALIAAAARAMAADPSLGGRTSEVVRARRIAVALAREAGFATAQIATALTCDRDTVARLGASCDPDDLVAARRGLAIDAAIARRRAHAA